MMADPRIKATVYMIARVLAGRGPALSSRSAMGKLMPLAFPIAAEMIEADRLKYGRARRRIRETTLRQLMAMGNLIVGNLIVDRVTSLLDENGNRAPVEQAF
jgi:hypothetical protein